VSVSLSHTQKVSASFPTTNGVVSSIDMVLQQDEASLSFSLNSYSYQGVNGFNELTTALQQGVYIYISMFNR